MRRAGAAVPAALRWLLWWTPGYSVLGAWAIAFVALRTHRELRKPLLPPAGGEEETR